MRRIVEHLTKEELKFLKTKTAPYGKLQEVADDAQIHVNTLRNIIRNGGGLTDNIEKLRCSVITTNLQQLANNSNVAA